MGKTETIMICVAVIFGIVLGFIIGNITYPDIDTKPKYEATAVLSQPVPNPVDYGNNVYYFPFARANFGNTLSAFLESHPQLEVTAISAVDGARLRGFTDGFFVVFKAKN